MIDAVRSQLFGGGDLSRDDPFRITGPAAVDKLVVLAPGDVRRHRIHVRREHHQRLRSRSGNDVATIAFDILDLNSIAKAAQQFR